MTIDTPNLISEQEFRDKFDDILEHVADQDEVFFITRFGKPAAALVPIRLYTLLMSRKHKPRTQPKPDRK